MRIANSYTILSTSPSGVTVKYRRALRVAADELADRLRRSGYTVKVQPRYDRER